MMNGNIAPIGAKVEIAEAFLRAFRPDGPWHLCQLHPDKKGMHCARVTDLGKWFNDTHNQYFHVNVTVPDPDHKDPDHKASKKQVTLIPCLHVDIDPRKGHDLATERQRIYALLTTGLKGFPAPTFVIDSGNGYQALWMLETPLTNHDEAEAYNRALAERFGGDDCYNIDRILRLPGSINLPNEKKREAGRVPAATGFQQHGGVYSIDRFEKATAKATATDAPSERPPALLVRDISGLPVSDRVKIAIAQGKDLDHPLKGDNSRSAWLWFVINEMLRAGVHRDTIYGVIMNDEWKISACVLDKARRAHDYAWEQIENAEAELTGEVIIVPSRELEVAQKFIQHDRPNLVIAARQFFDFVDSTHYASRSQEHVRSDLVKWLDEMAWYMKRVPGSDPAVFVKEKYHPYKKGRDAIFGMLQDQAFAPDTQMPCWLNDQGKGWNPSDVILLNTGLLNARTGETRPHTPDFLSTNLIPVAFDAGALCPTWRRCLGQWLPGQKAEELMLQEFFGLCLIADTSFQKGLMMVGPSRSGKGTITRMLTRLIGLSNVATPSLKSLSETFGMEQMLNKIVAIIADARVLGGKNALAEVLLGITGEDLQYVNQKGIRGRTAVKINTRFFILSNDLVRLYDPTGVLPNRFLYVIQKKDASFLGKEDIHLEDKLVAELPGILNWALEGLARLLARGKFDEPPSSLAARGELVRSCDLFGSWWQEATEPCLSTDFQPKGAFYDSFLKFCRYQGQAPWPPRKFDQALQKKVDEGELVPTRPFIEGHRPHCFTGRWIRDEYYEWVPSDFSEPPSHFGPTS